MRTDDVAAVEAAFVRYHADLQRYALFLGAATSDADDLVQEAFVRLLRTPRVVHDVGTSLRATVRNLVYDRSGPALRLRSVPDASDGGDGPSALAFDSDELAALWVGLGDLSPQQRNCVALTAIWGLGPDDVAAELGVRRSAVLHHLERAAEQLGRHSDADLPDAVGRMGGQLPAAAPSAGVLTTIRDRAAAAESRRLRRRRIAVVAVVTVVVGGAGAVTWAVWDSDVSTAGRSRQRTTTTDVPATTAVGPVTTATTTTTTTAVPAPPTAPVVPPQLVSVTEAGVGSSRRMVARLVDGSSGAIVRELGSWPLRVDGPTGEPLDPILDGDLGPDGTAYLAIRTRGGPGTLGGTELIAVDGSGRQRRVLPNATNVRVSPDGRRAAVEIRSPDGDGDGNGLHALRLVDLASGATSDLLADPIPLDSAGTPTVEFDAFVVDAWLDDGSAVVLRSFCCDSGAVSVVPVDRRSTLDALPQVRGSAGTALLGFAPDGSLLVQRDLEPTGPDEVSGSRIEVLQLDPRSGTVSPPVTSSGSTGAPRYDLVGVDVAGVLTDRARDALVGPGRWAAPGPISPRDRTYS